MSLSTESGVSRVVPPVRSKLPAERPAAHSESGRLATPTLETISTSSSGRAWSSSRYTGTPLDNVTRFGSGGVERNGGGWRWRVVVPGGGGGGGAGRGGGGGGQGGLAAAHSGGRPLLVPPRSRG